MRVLLKRLVLLNCVFFAMEASTQNLPDFSELVKKTTGAVVNISIVRHVPDENGHPPEGQDMPFPEGTPWSDFLKEFFEKYDNAPLPFDTQSIGSGFIISEDGYVITNAHVVTDADEIIIKLKDRRELSAIVVGADKHSDIALLKVEAKDLPVVEMGVSETLKAGQWVVAVGSPFGFEHSVTAGIVSAVGRTLPSVSYVSFIQTDVAVNPGNSGGPLFNMQGQVVGINSHIYSRTGNFMGVSFAIPSELAIHIADQLKADGFVTRGWLGVYIQEITRELSESLGLDKPQGVLVSGMTENSPAEAGGVEVGDVIIEYDGKLIETIGFLPPMVGRTEPGKKVPISILRNGKLIHLNVTIKELPDDQHEHYAEHNGKKDQHPDIATLGLTVREMTSEEEAEFELKDKALVIEEITAGAAKQAGLSAGDLILMINNQRFDNVKEFIKIVESLPREQFIIVLIMRDSLTRFLALKIPAAEE